MARGDAKLWLIMGGGVAVGASVFAWYFLVGNRSAKRDEAQQPIAAWSAEWHKARACLLGEHPPAGTAAEVLTMRAMLGETRSCSFSELGRPEGMASGIDEVEAAWDDAEQAWHKLVVTGNAAEQGPLIEALDKAEADLRRATGMADVPWQKPVGGGPRDLPATPPVPGTAGRSFGALTAHDHALSGESSRGDEDSEVLVRGPADVTFVRAAPDVLRAVPDPSWGARIVRHPDDETKATIRAGAVAPDGTLAADAGIAIDGKVAALLAAFGGGAGPRQLLVLLDEPKDPVAILRSTDGGAHWSKPVRVPGSGLATETTIDRPSGAVFLRWPKAAAAVPPPADDDEYLEPTIEREYGYLGAGVPELARGPIAPDADLDRPCFASGGLWHTAGGDTLVHVVPGGPSSAIPLGDKGGARIAACTKDAAAIDRDGIRRCAGTACEPPTPLGGRAGQGPFIDLFDGSGVIIAQQVDRLIAVRRSGVEPVFVRAPAGLALVGVTIWNQVPTFALVGPDGLHLAPMP
jgi:hypothetical protein